ncbi:MAG: hypothetical protein AUK48_05510 [Oscillatoriales cyanobacterium CG2_30_44_21]|nr:MAG: hypothetical protein AUK48_05510 [Oscillatoriales cyanobacterium CG2_30_44_21]
MNKHYQRIAQFSAIAITGLVAISLNSVSPVFAQRRGDADQLRPAQGKPISPTNTDQFSPDGNVPNSELNLQNINLEVEEVQPVIPGNNNASPQKVNRSGTFSSDPLNAIQIFQGSSSTRR